MTSYRSQIRKEIADAVSRVQIPFTILKNSNANVNLQAGRFQCFFLNQVKKPGFKTWYV
jgi:hypothetical protein